MGFLARRLFLVGALLAALAMVMAPALASADDDDDDGGGGGDRAFCAPAGPPDPAQCSTFGGQIGFDFDVSSGPLGENPTGTARVESRGLGGLFWEVQVTCLQVTGNRASFGGTVTDTDAELLLGRWWALTVLDNGPPAPDLASNGTFLTAAPPANPPTCGDETAPDRPVTGDIVVQDNIGGGGGGDEDDGDDDEEDDEDV